MQDTTVNAQVVQVQGKLTSDNGNFATDGVNGSVTAAGITTTNLIASQQYGGVTGGSAGASILTSGTISSATRISKVTAGSAVTAVIVGSGVQDGQELTIVHVGAAASSIAFATAGSAAASSHAATDFVISGQTCSKFVWDSGTALWYPVVF